MTVGGIIDLVALVVFAAALCWRLDQVRRHGGGLQAVAMTIAIAALTLAFVVANHTMARVLDEHVFAGSSRYAFYALLAIGVAGLVIVFFYPRASVSRERRAGIEAVPLVVALIGLQVSLALVPDNLRTAPIGDWTLQSWAFAVFYLISSGYLAYGFVACVRSVRRFLELADGTLRTALRVLIVGLTLLAVGALAQIVYVLFGAAGRISVPWLLTVSRVLDAVGVVAFLVGISFPMLRSRWESMRAAGRRRRADEALRPLWELVTSAVPEVVLPGRSGGPTQQLHRRVVETRDALTQISPFLPETFEALEPATQAVMLRSAVADYAAADSASGSVRTVFEPHAVGLDADAAPLIEVAGHLEVHPASVTGRHREQA